SSWPTSAGPFHRTAPSRPSTIVNACVSPPIDPLRPTTSRTSSPLASTKHAVPNHSENRFPAVPPHNAAAPLPTSTRAATATTHRHALEDVPPVFAENIFACGELKLL